MQDLNDLAAFAAVVQHRGFAPAARALGQPKSSLSRRVSRLEARMGVRPWNAPPASSRSPRSARRCSATPRAAAAGAQSAEEAALAQGVEPRGVVRASVPVQIAQGGLSAILPRFLAAHPWCGCSCWSPTGGWS